MGAEGHKSQAPAEQGHQIKVCCYDLVHSAAKAAADNYKEGELVVPFVSSQINITYRINVLMVNINVLCHTSNLIR